MVAPPDVGASGVAPLDRETSPRLRGRINRRTRHRTNETCRSPSPGGAERRGDRQCRGAHGDRGECAGAVRRAARARRGIGAARPLSDACPAQLPVRQSISEAIAGWTPLDQQGNQPFQRVAFFPGPPADSSLIVPTAEYKGQTGLHDRWDLPRRAGGYWMTCAYGNTTATVARKLADDVDFCQADYDGRFLTLVVRHWSCGVKRLMEPPAWTRPATRPAARPPVRRGG